MNRPWAVMATLVVIACGGDSRPSAETANPEDGFGDPWLTELEYEFGESVGGDGDASFSPISSVRVLGDAERILVVEAAALRVTIWTPNGSLVREVGRPGQGPGEFSGALFVEVHRGGFHTRDSQRYSSFSSDGALIETVPYPPPRLSFRGFPLRPRALLRDGSLLAMPQIPSAALAGFGGDEPIEHLPVYHVRAEGEDWTLDRIATIDVRNRHMSIRPEGTPLEERGVQAGQFFGDFDLTWFDPEVGSVVVLRRNLGGGSVELLEIGASGDTVWRRQVSPAPVTLDPGRLDTFIDGVAQQLATVVGGGGEQSASLGAFTEAIEEVVYVPDPLPGATRLHGTSSGEIWFQGFQMRDTLSVWHAIGRGDASGRVVLLPSGFRAMDATDSHVWGVRRDELGVPYVVGRRLVPPG